MRIRGLAVLQPCRLSDLVPFRSQTFSQTLPNAKTGFVCCDSDIIISVHCSGQSASQVDD